MTIGADLIRQAYIIAKVLDPEEELEGYQATQGLTSLNAIIDQWSSLQIYIPSYTVKEFNTVAGTYTYTVTSVITQLLEAHFLDSNNVQWQLQPIDLKRQNTLNYALSSDAPTRPSVIFVDAQMPTFVSSSTVYLYPVPDQVYAVKLYAKQRLARLDQSTDITNIPAFEFKALIYQLSKDTAAINGTVLTQEFYDDYERLMKELAAANKQDMTVQNQNPFQSYRQFRPWSTYGRGW